MKLIQLFLLSVIVLSSCNDEAEPSGDGGGTAPAVHGVLNDEFSGQSIVVYANGSSNTLVAYSRSTNVSSELLEFELSDDLAPAVLKDQFGNNYDIYGYQVGDEATGDVFLKPIDHIVGYWFFFSSFYEEVVLNDGSKITNPAHGISSEDWLIDTDFIFTGSSRDGIPSIDEPSFLPLDGKEFADHDFYTSLSLDDLVTVVRQGKNIHVYPHQILEYHEVVNDVIGGNPIAVSYCPLTGTSRAWGREVKGQVSEFGVSGLLYNNNLIMYDRISDSYWSQILDVSIWGDCISNQADALQVFETTFARASRLDGSVSFLSNETGFSFDYDRSIYDDYRFTAQVSFPLSNQSTNFEPKDRVLGFVDGDKVKVYSFKDFE